MKVDNYELYAVISKTWIEDYYEVDELVSDLFITKEKAFNFMENMALEDEEKSIYFVKDGVNYKIVYYDYDEDYINNDINNLYKNETVTWYYVKSLNVLK